MDLLINTKNIKYIAKSAGISKKKKKNRFDTILEPLQGILQLALLSFCKKGTKLTILNNCIFLQEPYYSQGIVRWYQNDSKSDISFLLYICKRFPIFYPHLNSISSTDKNGKTINLYDILVELAIKGLNKLVETYENTEEISILHNIELYKMLLQNNLNNKTELNESEKNINKIFINISEIYDDDDYYIIFNTLKKLIKNPQDSKSYISGLNKIIGVSSNNVHKWILSNMMY